MNPFLRFLHCYIQVQPFREKITSESPVDIYFKGSDTKIKSQLFMNYPYPQRYGLCVNALKHRVSASPCLCVTSFMGINNFAFVLPLQQKRRKDIQK